jgi:hypothetical protein
MALQLYLLENFGIIHRVLAFVKDESRHLGSMAMALLFIIDYKPLEIRECVNVLVLGMSCLKFTNMQLMMIRFLWD